MIRLALLAAIAWTGIALGHAGLTAALAIPDITARAAQEARW